MTRIDPDSKKGITSNAATAQANNDGYRRLEILRSYILEQTMDETAYVIGSRILAESRARRRK
jgi:hypothetical protein